MRGAEREAIVPQRIKNIFSGIPRTYELVNHILTLGLDVCWRKKAAKKASREGGIRWLDVCSGTGEMALLLSQRAGGGTVIIASDFCFPMLRKAAAKRKARRISLCLSDARRLPFSDNIFDVVTISFATRNINVNSGVLLKCFDEFYRILRPGGRFINLETSQPSLWIVRKLFHMYVHIVVKPLGYLLSGSKAAYQYLSYTIPRFFQAEELSSILYQSGFAKVDVSYMTFGICAIHRAVK